MALTAKSIQAAAGSAQLSRSGPAQRAPSNPASPVEEVYPTTGAAFDGSLSVQVRDENGGEFPSQRDSRGGQQRSLPDPHTGRVSTNSQSFAQLLETRDRYEATARADGGHGVERLGRSFANVVRLYELSAGVIAREEAPAGESLSVLL